MESTKSNQPATDRQQASTGAADQTGWESPDIHYEVATVLRAKRWEVRDGPFQGFGSPPGKF